MTDSKFAHKLKFKILKWTSNLVSIQMANTLLEKLSSSKSFEGELLKYKFKVGINPGNKILPDSP